MRFVFHARDEKTHKIFFKESLSDFLLVTLADYRWGKWSVHPSAPLHRLCRKSGDRSCSQRSWLLFGQQEAANLVFLSLAAEATSLNLSCP